MPSQKISALIENDDMTSWQKADAIEPIRGDEGASILGPRNHPLERENPDLLSSPSESEVLFRGRAEPPRNRGLGA